MNSLSITRETSHRPWPLPRTPWVLFMRWHDLLFLHWPVRPELIRPLIPHVLDLDTFDGWCWIGIVPFRMSGVRPRYCPFAMDFPELNVRTYIKGFGRSGVWFFTLDAAHRLAVGAARWLGMPYHFARITVASKENWIDYKSVRFQRKSAPAHFDASYRSSGATYHAAAGTLDRWLTERYCLFAALKPKQVVYGEIHHAQWALQPAEAQLRANTMAQTLGIDLPPSAPLCHFARYQEVVSWPILPIEKMT